MTTTLIAKSRSTVAHIANGERTYCGKIVAAINKIEVQADHKPGVCAYCQANANS